MAKSKKIHSEEQDISLPSTRRISEKERQWTELIYSDSIPLSLTWEGRVAETTRRMNFSISNEALREASREFFLYNTKAEAYWSLVVMYHNVCDSIRTPEMQTEGKTSNENSSYKVKIENSLKLKPVMDEIKRLAEDLFKKNEVAEADFNAGKIASDFGEGALEAALREVNNESGSSKSRKRKEEEEA